MTALSRASLEKVACVRFPTCGRSSVAQEGSSRSDCEAFRAGARSLSELNTPVRAEFFHHGRKLQNTLNKGRFPSAVCIALAVELQGCSDLSQTLSTAELFDSIMKGDLGAQVVARAGNECFSSTLPYSKLPEPVIRCDRVLLTLDIKDARTAPESKIVRLEQLFHG